MINAEANKTTRWKPSSNKLADSTASQLPPVPVWITEIGKSHLLNNFSSKQNTVNVNFRPTPSQVVGFENCSPTNTLILDIRALRHTSQNFWTCYGFHKICIDIYLQLGPMMVILNMSAVEHLQYTTRHIQLVWPQGQLRIVPKQWKTKHFCITYSINWPLNNTLKYFLTY